MTGYLHSGYITSMAEFGQPMELPHCGGWLLQRLIPATTRNDAMGCYPLFCCRDWSKLSIDMDTCAEKFVSVALVLDPFTTLSAEELKRSFDIVRPFKDHYIVDLSMPFDQHVKRHHRYYARKSLREIKVEIVNNPQDYLQEWKTLYETLVRRHQLSGIKAFSITCFRQQFTIPGLVMFRATCRDQVIGAQLWYVQGNVAYSHLTAVNDVGYASRATYGIYWTAINVFKEHFANEVRYLDLGAGAGLSANGNDGLSEFKRGWANDRRIKYFAAKILDRKAYADLSKDRGSVDDGYFPAYRKGEF